MSTDTHHTRELGRMEWGVLHATRGWVDPRPHREPVASREVPRMATEAAGLTAEVPAAPFRVFLLSPADCSGKRAALLQRPGAEHDLGRRLHGDEGARSERYSPS